MLQKSQKTVKSCFLDTSSARVIVQKNTLEEYPMLTGELKNKIDSLWEMFWTGGITNPLDVVEQMTYLMFIHDLDETDAKKAKSSMMLELPYTSIFEGHD